MKLINLTLFISILTLTSVFAANVYKDGEKQDTAGNNTEITNLVNEVTAPTAAEGSNNKVIATTEYVERAVDTNTDTWPSAVTTSGTWTINYSDGLMQRILLDAVVTNVVFETLTNTMTAVTEMYITGATNSITWPASGFTWVNEPTWTNNSVHVIFSWSLGVVSGAKDKEL